MLDQTEGTRRFIEVFENLYGRKPKRDDLEGDFKLQVALDMDMSVGGARYFLRLAAEQMKKNA